MKKQISNGLILISALTLIGIVGCESGASAPFPQAGDAGPGFDEITKNPKEHDTVHGCWFDPLTLAHVGTETKTLCQMRKNGKDVSCKDLCQSSAFKVWETCGSVSACRALLWVDKENPLSCSDERGCWECVDGCVADLDRSIERFHMCRTSE